MKHVRWQIKITLNGIRPPIWRRLLVPPDCPMDTFHLALQIAMGWENAHLYAFVIPAGRRIKRIVQAPSPDDMWDPEWSRSPKPEDSDKVRLCDFAKPGETFRYDYDFGDGWEHDVKIEQAVPCKAADAHKIECLAGSRACPPEDCGGPWGYQNLLDLLEKPTKELSQAELERLECIGEDWDAEAFDPEKINAILASVPGTRCAQPVP
ncbi:MAG: plasmid pRiA4b ORF-3 family protein [Mariprofundaceae bacterium]